MRVASEVAAELDRLIPGEPGTIVSLYWPFRGELDLRDWMRSAAARGVRIALPVVVEKGQPLVFREWLPGARLTRGVWNIPIPADGAEVTPGVIISPVVGFDPRNYRLGYGGGFFDRTLAAMKTPRRVIGVGHPSGALPTIHPQPHDIPMDIIVTGGSAKPGQQQ
jgi:5-formyltetrahydrofolate cyclo-ligase